jgi:hypothetical protein
MTLPKPGPILGGGVVRDGEPVLLLVHERLASDLRGIT